MTPPKNSWPWIGHEELGKRLMTALEQNRLPTVMLFRGPAHIGKASAAVWMAQLDLCQSSKQRPCHVCVSCRHILSGQHPGCLVVTTEDTSSISIDRIRSVLSQFTLRANTSERRWLIIADADQLTESASNALLKFSEEPPPQVNVILTSSYPQRLLPTLRSRAAQWFWHLVPVKQLAAASQESSDMRDALARQRAVSRLAGRPGWRPSVLAEQHRTQERAAVRLLLDRWQKHQPLSFTEQPADMANLAELCIRELLLTKYGATARTLWPDLASDFAAVSATRTLGEWYHVYEQFRQRHSFLAQHGNPRLVYEDLQLT